MLHGCIQILSSGCMHILSGSLQISGCIQIFLDANIVLLVHAYIFWMYDLVLMHVTFVNSHCVN